MTLRNVGSIIEVPKLNEKIQCELQEYQQLSYDAFVHDFVQIVVIYENLLFFKKKF